MASKTEVFQVRRGQTLAFGLGPIDDPNNAAVSTFSLADTPTAFVWAGDATAAVATPSVAWQGNPAGGPAYLTLTIAPADTAALEAQPYPMEVRVAHSGASLLVWEGWLDLLEGPGTTPAAAVYGTFADMLGVAGEWVKGLLYTSGTAGFVRERARARSYLEDILLARCPRQQLGLFDISLGLGGFTMPEAPSVTLRGYLAANKLMVTAKVREIVAHLAVSLACRRDIAGDGFEEKRRFHWGEAHRLIAGYVAEVDTNADGLADFTINCGVISTRSSY